VRRRLLAAARDPSRTERHIADAGVGGRPATGRSGHPETTFRPPGSILPGTALTDHLSPFIIAVT
jgi:hypothetical protein